MTADLETQMETCGDECGKIIPHLVITNPSLWPQSLKDYLQQELGKTPAECASIEPESSDRFKFDQAVRRWVTFDEEGEADLWIRTQSAVNS